MTGVVSTPDHGDEVPVGISVGFEGSRLVAVKRATGDRAQRLEHEARVLGRVAHPGVVDLIELRKRDATTELVTEYVGAESLASARIGPDDAGPIMSSLATTVAVLHGRGVVHHGITADHVLLAPDRVPILCGFGASISHEGAAPPPDAAEDVGALGILLHELLEGDLEPEPIPDFRLGWAHRATPWTGYHRRALLTLADQASADDPERRPSAAGLAQSISDASAVTSPAPKRRLRVGSTRRWGAVGAAVVAVAALIVGTAALAGYPRSSAAAPEDCGSAAAPGPSGDGCAPPDSASGPVLTTGEGRFEAGTTGDVIALGDWDCDSVATPALLRPESGDIFVFNEWPDLGEPIESKPVTRDRDVVAIEAEAGPDDCDRLMTRDANGHLTELNW